MSQFGISPFTEKKHTQSNVFVDKHAVIATVDQTTFVLPFSAIERNLLVYDAGSLVNTNDYTIMYENQVVFATGRADGAVITFVTFMERAGQTFTRRTTSFLATGAGTVVETGFDYNPTFTNVFRNGVAEYYNTSWTKTGTTIVLSEAYSADDRFHIYEDVPNTVEETKIDWSRLENIPDEFPGSSVAVNAILEGILKETIDGQGSDYIAFDETRTVRDVLTSLETEFETFDPINKSGATGLGLLGSTEFRLTAKQNLFRTHYTSASDFSGIKANSNGEVTFVQSIPTQAPGDTFVIKTNDVWHRAIGNFRDFFYPKSGMLYNGIGAYSVWESDPAEGTVVTPPGWPGTWRVQGVVNAGLPNRMSLLVRIA